MTTTAQPAILTSIAGITADALFAPGGVDAILKKIDAEVRIASPDIATKTGREAIASAAYKVARAKTALDDMGKELVADWKKKSAAVDADRRKIREGLDTLKDSVRQPLTDWENTEKARVEGHEAAIATAAAMLAHHGERSPAEIEAQLLELGQIAQRDWQEYEARAVSTLDHVRKGLMDELAAAKKREADRAELERLRQEAAERERKDHEERIAREAGERARTEAENAARAERERLESERVAAERRAQEAEADRVAATEQAERDRQAAVQAERDRIEAEQRAEQEAARKRENNRRHASKINNEVLAALVGVGVDVKLGKIIIASIVRREIPHVSITY